MVAEHTYRTSRTARRPSLPRLQTERDACTYGLKLSLTVYLTGAAMAAWMLSSVA